MVKFRNIVLVAAIGIVILFSGCIGNQETKPAETAQQTAVQTTSIQSTAVQTAMDPYTVQVNEVRTLQDCIVSTVSTQATPCSLINLEIRNNNIKNPDFSIVKDQIVSKSGKNLGERYDRQVGLSNSCVRQSGMDLKLNVNSYQNVGMCYPIIHKSDEPILNIAIMINGERKEYKFDLLKYGLQD
ncbi:MAG: hypothetical protein O8C66_06500 [Candidatus Methanoperedens sp.]|nr:hypothetical protein [Candidatus Methanoperedens sp.]MCZ7370141.1 hypothetical protein [Candidatus Methanoperedens sp.]